MTELDKRSIRVTNQLVDEELGRMELGRLQLVDWLQLKDDHVKGRTFEKIGVIFIL